MIGSHQDTLVAGAGGHRGEGVHVLCAGDAGNTIEGDGGDSLGGESAHHLVIDGRCRVDKGNEHLPAVHHIDLVRLLLLIEERLLHLQYHLGTIVYFLRVADHSGAFAYVVLVMKEGTIAGMALYKHLKTILYKLAHCFGRCCYTSLVVHNLLGYSDNHSISYLVVCFRLANILLFLFCLIIPPLF